MAKKQKHVQKSKNSNTQNKRNGFKIPEDAAKLAKLEFKKFKKKNKDWYESNKDLKKAYYGQMIDYLPSSISLIVKYGHLDQVQDTKVKIYQKLMDPKFISYLIKEIDKRDLEFDNMILLPIIVRDIRLAAEKEIEATKAENPDAEVTIDLTDVMNLSKLILKKKIKKMKKAGIDEDLAFEVLSILPSVEVLKKSQAFHIRSLFTELYGQAKTKTIDFEKTINLLFKDDKDNQYLPSLITFALLERKEKIGTMNDSQKKLFNDITEYCFKTLEDMKKANITAVLKAYVSTRAKDEAAGRDTNRRYYISSLPETDYPKILKAVEKLIEEKEDNRKYF